MRIVEVGWPAIGAFGTALAAAGADLPAWGVGLIAAAAALLGAALAHALACRRDRDEAATLRTALRRRDEQLAHTAHELRTPLASVITALEMLRAGYATSPSETEEFLDQAAMAAQHLAFLVNDVLDEAALQTGRLRLSCGCQRVGELLLEAERIMGLQARSRGVALHIAEVDPELCVHTDERRFLQIVFDLVGNALKFSASGEVVHVRVEANAKRVRFLVIDHGPGVPQAARENLFLPFGYAEVTPGRAIQGTGLGLFVCRQLVEQIGGKIGYEPAARGSVFWFDQPRSEVARASACRADPYRLTAAAGTVPAAAAMRSDAQSRSIRTNRGS